MVGLAVLHVGTGDPPRVLAHGVEGVMPAFPLWSQSTPPPGPSASSALWDRTSISACRSTPACDTHWRRTASVCSRRSCAHEQTSGSSRISDSPRGLSTGSGGNGDYDRRLLPHSAAEVRGDTLGTRRFKGLCRQQSRAPAVPAHGTQGTQLRRADEPRGALSHDGRVRGLPSGDQPREPIARAGCPEVERGAVQDCQRRARGAGWPSTRRGSPARQVPFR